MIALSTPDTQAVLLLCARLGQGNENGVKPLTVRQYSVLARWLRECALRPADLLNAQGRERLSEMSVPGVDRSILERLLDRGAALGILTERWSSRGLWVVSRADIEYPSRYKNYLGHLAPPLIYGVGGKELLQSGGLAVVGSRHAAEDDLDFARRVALACAQQRLTVISGGAKGVDSVSMMMAVDSGGRSVGILAEGLGKAAVASQYHEALLETRLTLISPYEPESRWFTYTAMERNKLIYGLSDAALVVTSSDEEGGTWAGATEALKHGRVRVYVKASGSTSPAIRKLLGAGAYPFPEEPWSDLRTLLSKPSGGNALSAERTVTILDEPRPEEALPPVNPQSIESPHRAAEQPTLTDLYSHALPIMLRVLMEPCGEQVIADRLNILPTQARAWLKRAVAEGKVRKLTKPVRYISASDSISQPDHRQQSFFS